MLPITQLAEFQTGLTKLALHSGNLKSSEVFGDIQQALHRAPCYPESHNLKGLVCEARHDYQSAIASYRLARYAAGIFDEKESKTYLNRISSNLARSLCRAGNANDAVDECEDLDKRGLLDVEGLQIYALCLWKLGKNNLALSVARKLATNVSSMDQSLVSTSVSFICRLQYQISGQDAAILNLLKLPKGLSQTSKVILVASAIHALDHKNQLDSVISSARNSIASTEGSAVMDFLVALGELLKHGSKGCLGFKKGLEYLRKSLHMSPNSHLIRNLLGYLLLLRKQWKDFHASTRCIIVNPSDHPNEDDKKSALEIFGAEGVACHAFQCCKTSLATCRGKSTSGCNTMQLLQKHLHQEPWNQTTWYLLITNYFQRARQERYPHYLCVVLDRLIDVALSNELYSRKDPSFQYQKFQLLLSAAEVSLQCGNYFNCIKNATSASELSIPDRYIFFAHLLLCRAYAVGDNPVKLSEEYLKCLELKNGCHIGWICLKFLESQYKIQADSTVLALRFEECSKDVNTSWNVWLAIFSLVQGLSAIWIGDFTRAEEYLSQACSLACDESCLLLCHGAICMELARQHCDSKFLSHAIRSLKKAKDATPIPMPFISLLLAQAEASLGSESKWEKNLHEEWSSWPPEMKPAELLFQMHLVSRHSQCGTYDDSSLEPCADSIRQMLQAIHLNPSSSRYWRVLRSSLSN
nr:tetratricopeptide repeat protein SKI3 [Ipomoea batatas]